MSTFITRRLINGEEGFAEEGACCVVRFRSAGLSRPYSVPSRKQVRDDVVLLLYQKLYSQ